VYGGVDADSDPDLDEGRYSPVQHSIFKAKPDGACYPAKKPVLI